MRKHQHKSNYKEGSLSLIGAVAMGTGVMIGAGIFALTGQVAELAREWFPLAFIIAAMITSASAYSYVKLSMLILLQEGLPCFYKKLMARGLPLRFSHYSCTFQW